MASGVHAASEVKIYPFGNQGIMLSQQGRIHLIAGEGAGLEDDLYGIFIGYTLGKVDPEVVTYADSSGRIVHLSGQYGDSEEQQQGSKTGDFQGGYNGFLFGNAIKTLNCVQYYKLVKKF